jgi:hypothetical protein
MEKRNEFIKKFEENLNDYNAKVAELKARIADEKAELKADYLVQLEKNDHQRNEFVTQLGKLKKANGHAWEDLQVGTEKAWKELEHSFKIAVTRFK